MTLPITLNPASEAPPFEQIRDQIAAMIERGELAAGHRLPSIRSLATTLGVAAGTVARAYRELEAAGVLVTARRHGTVVAGEHGAAPPHVLVAANEYIRLAAEAGLTPPEMADILNALLSRRSSP